MLGTYWNSTLGIKKWHTELHCILSPVLKKRYHHFICLNGNQWGGKSIREEISIRIYFLLSKSSHFISFKWRFSSHVLIAPPLPAHQSHKIVFLYEQLISFSIQIFFWGGLSFYTYETKENLIQKIRNTFLPAIIIKIKSTGPHLNNKLWGQIYVCPDVCQTWESTVSFAAAVMARNLLCAGPWRPHTAALGHPVCVGGQWHLIPGRGPCQCTRLELFKWHEWKTLCGFSVSVYVSLYSNE